MKFKQILWIIGYAGIIVNSLFIALVFFNIGINGSITISHYPYQKTVWFEFAIAIFIFFMSIKLVQESIKDMLGLKDVKFKGKNR